MLTAKNLIGYALSGEGGNNFSSSVLIDEKACDYSFHEASTREIDRCSGCAGPTGFY